MSREEKIKSCLQVDEQKLCKAESGAFCFKDIYKKDKKDIKKEEVLSYLINTFGLQNYENFPSKFDEAVGGDGNESVKMVSIKSSSLCALLTFFNVKEGNPITINGQKYDQSYFEVKNQVFNNPSNMDVVLINKKEKKILFVECKFSEYLNQSKIEISNAYRNNAISNEIYDEAINKAKLFHATDEKSKEGYSYYLSEKCYMGGLKQIISHYVGLINFIKRNKKEYMKNEPEKKVKDIYQYDYDSVSFIEVLFKLDTFPDELAAYQKKSEKLFDIIRNKNTGINFLEGTTYQKIIKDKANKSFVLPDEVKKYYKY